jgi:hypothetical protein
MQRRHFFVSMLALLPSLFNLKAQAKTNSSSMPEDSVRRSCDSAVF